MEDLFLDDTGRRDRMHLLFFPHPNNISYGKMKRSYTELIKKKQGHHIPHTITSGFWKQSCSRFSEQLDFFQLENSIKFVPSKFYLLCFVSMVFSHLPYILAHDFSIGISERSHCSTAKEVVRARGSHQTRIYKHLKNH